MAVTKDELKVIGKQLTELLRTYNAMSILIFERTLDVDDTKLVILFRDINGKVVAEREFPKDK